MFSRFTGNSFKVEPSDFIVVVMGPTGSGKTNFINSLTGKAEADSARKLRSDTESVTPHVIPDKNPRIVLVDTPGFDNTYRSDSEILRFIADWLTQKYSTGKVLRVHGIIYLHRITDQRLIGSVNRNLQMFGRICGNIPLRRARLVTTMWDTEREQGAAQHREAELKRDFWKPLLDEGAAAAQFHNTKESAWAIIEALLSLHRGGGDDMLLLQEELVHQRRHLNETEAGKAICSRLQQMFADQQRTLKELADEAKMQNDPILAKSLQEQYDNTSIKLQKTFDEIKEMKIPFFRQINLRPFGRRAHGRAIRITDI